ncbi:MAG: hypothetical protein IJC91_03830, partial [Oscillospiraceae bacterium]|nr:hypothetical protein [Oscillospiraceae bacterium]
MKKRLFAILMTVTLLMSASLPALAAKTETYEAAKPTAEQEATITHIEGDKYNLVRNGDFEVVASTGNPVYFNPVQTDGKFMTAVGKEGDTGNFARFTEATNVYLTTSIRSYVVGGTYTLSADIRVMEGEPNPYMQMTCQAGGTIILMPKELKQGKWVHVSQEVVIPEGTKSITLMVRATAGGEVHYDNIALIGSPTEDVRIGMEFREQMAKDAAHRDKLAPTLATQKGMYDLDAPFTGQSNIVLNSDFEDFTGTQDLKDWTVQERHRPNISIVTGDAKSGNAAVRMYADAGAASGFPFYSQWVDIVGGAEYQVSYWYKILQGGEAA